MRLAEVLGVNPLWVRTGGALPSCNHLLWLYGGPAALVLLAADFGRDGGRGGPAQAAGPRGHGAVLRPADPGGQAGLPWGVPQGGAYASSEKYAYSIAWVLFGTLLLVLGIVTKGPVLRFSSLAVMLLAVEKVFLYDTAQLRDLYRVFSFLGLGLSLLLLAFLYQRFVWSGLPRAGNARHPVSV